MVTTRRSTANGAATNGASTPKSTNTANDTTGFLRPSCIKVYNAPNTPKLSSTALEPAHLDSISEYDLSLTSPPTRDTPEKMTMSTPKQTQVTPNHTGSMFSSVPRRLAPKPANATGGAFNPIIVTDSSPPSQPARDHKRKQKRGMEPHKFIDRGYRKLYNYRPSRPALGPKPANGSTFTGHQSHDIYRMMNAKIAAASAWNANEIPNYTNYRSHGVPFEVQYPMSAQYVAQNPGPVYQQQTPYFQYYSHPAPQLNGYPLVSATKNEEMLRKKAVQYVREYSRPTPRKRRLSTTDPDETSESESEYHTKAAPVPSSLASSPPHPSLTSPSSPLTSAESVVNTKLSVSHDNDPNFDITQLTEQTTILTSLLQIYPHSADQKGLREDIAMLVSVQNQRVKEWMKMESQNARKRRKSSNTDSAISVSSANDGSVASAVKAQQRLDCEKKRRQDDEMRQFFSAAANMWQTGSGEGLADVFAQAPTSSSPAKSFNGGLVSPERKMVGSGGGIMRSEGVDSSPNAKMAGLDGKASGWNGRV